VQGGLPSISGHRHGVRGRILGIALACGLLGLAQARGQGPNHSASKFYPDSSDTAEALLRNAAGHARDGQWAEAIDIYQRIIGAYGDKVAKLPREKREGAEEGPDEFVLFVDLRGHCHRSLAKLPPEARAIYRNRVDGQAERWYREGERLRDPALLRRVVDEAFCSSWGDDALELLGDLAFQGGRFGEALASYRQLVLDRPEDAFNLVHPDPSVDLARVAAKKLLCRAAAGEAVAAAEIDALAKRYPGASGALAGRKGPYANVVAEALKSDHLAPTGQPDSRWPTFAGSLSRTKVVAEAVDVGSMQWRIPLDRIAPVRSGYAYSPRAMAMNASPYPQDRLLCYHPIVLGDQVVVCDASKVVAYNLNDRPGGREGPGSSTIEPAWKHDPENTVPQVNRGSGGIPRFSLTAVGNRIYARMGASTPSGYMGMNRSGAFTSSYIIALDWSAQGKFLWQQRAGDLVLPNRQADRSRSINFEGTPVADGHNVYVAVTDRREQTATYVACFDAETGGKRWVRYLGAAASEIDNFMAMGMGFGPPIAGDYGHRLLTLEGPFLYYQTNLGAVVSLDAETGAVRWVANYPRQDSARAGQGSDRDLNPAVVHEGLVIVAPSDASSIFAFDSDSGRLVWRTEPIADEVKLSHLLGVAKGRLVATGDRVLLFDVKTGKLVSTWPDSGKAPEGYGRGLLAGSRIYWPTRNEIQVLDQRTGLLADRPIRLMEVYRTTGGNLVAADGYLIVAQSDGLVVFCQNSRLIERYRDEIARAPGQAAPYYRLARAAEAVGRDSLALEAYEQATLRAQGSETVDGVSLVDAARDHHFRLLTRLAGTARRDRRFEESASRLDHAARISRSDSDRLRARLLLADVRLEAGKPADAVEILEQVLTDDRLKGLTVSSEDGHRAIRADLLIADRLAGIVRQGGRELYAPFEQRAGELYRRGLREQDPRLLDEVSRVYPVSEAVPDALLALGEIHESAGRMGPAARAYKRLLSLPTASDRARARALWRLAHAYAAENFLVSARDTYLQLLQRYPQVRLDGQGTGAPLGDLVTVELARPPLAQIAADRPRPPVPFPLERAWRFQAPGPRTVRVLTAPGMPPGLHASRVFLVEGTKLSPLDPASGQPRWSVDMGAPAVWVGYLADKLLAATSQRVVALELDGGAEQWRFAPGGKARPRRVPDPFARAEAATATPEAARGPFHEFQLVGGRLYFLRGEEELVALDGDTGAVDWSFSPRGSPINPRLWIGPARAVLQVQTPGQVLVLDTETGAQVARTPLADGEALERPPVPIDDDHVLLVTDRRTVKKFDMNRGQFTWDYCESREMPVFGPPRVLVDAERVLVLHDGKQLIRLDPMNGSRRWATVLGIENLSEREGAIACDEKRIYCVSRQNLRALSFEDGQTTWSCHLSGPENAQWSIALSENTVVAFPSQSLLSEDETENMPVVVRRQETGALVQRFVFPATIADVSLRLDAKGALVATSRSLWALAGHEAGPDSKPITPP
jgi:outer membrane protein assembly factor BamB/tetratricopeptide (TPR) repeat protein